MFLRFAFCLEKKNTPKPALHVLPYTPFLFYKNSFYKNPEAENRPKVKNFVRITLGSRSRDL